MHPHFDALPKSIADHPCVLWKYETRGGQDIKPPYQSDGKSYASSMSPATWSEFGSCRDFIRDNPEYGLGVILGGRNDDRLVGFDLDDIDHVAPEHRAESERWRRRILGLPTYAELSPSGQGVHVIARGVLPNNATAYNALKIRLGIEIYSAKRYLTMTGRRLANSTDDFVDCQLAINALVSEIEATTGTVCGADFDIIDECDTFGRRLDLTDAEVLERARAANKKFSGWVDASWGPGIWSDINVQVIGDLDKVTGSQEQIRRIVMAMPYVAKSPPANNRETREHKVWRRLAKDLAKQRAGNDKLLAEREADRQRLLAERPHLDAILEATFAYNDRLKFGTLTPRVYAVPPVPSPPDAAPSPVQPHQSNAEPGDTLTEVTKTLLCGTSAMRLGSEVLEHLIDLNLRSMKKPFRPYAEIATVASFGAILARKFKSSDGLSTAAMEMLIAPTASGKGEAFTFWSGHMAKRATPQNPPKVMTGSASSAEALHGVVQTTGTTLWIRADATADIRMLAEPKDVNQVRFRDYIYELFDASRDNQPPMMPPASIAACKRNDRPIHNACCSLLWSTTPASFNMVYNMTVLASGLGSRVLVTVHDNHSGDLVPDAQVSKRLDQQATEIINHAMLLANEIDEAYDRRPEDGDALVQYVGYSSGARDFIWEIEKSQNFVHRGVDKKNLPDHYAVFLRTSMLTKKLALLSALIRHLDSPQVQPCITREDVEWALARVVRSMASLARMFDEGNLGEGGDAERRAAFKSWVIAFFDPKNPPRDKRITSDMLSERILPRWWLAARAGKNRAFAKHPFGSDRALDDLLKALTADGVLAIASSQSGGQRYKIVQADLL